MDVTPSEKRRKRKPRRRNKVTVLQVAKHAGVSSATVSRCLTNPDIVRAPLRAKVEAAIEVLGYTPDLAARFMVTQRSATIGVIVPTLDIASFARGVQMLQQRLDAAQYTTLLAISNYDKIEEFRHAKNLVSRGIDGMMLVGLDHDPKLYELFDQHEIPFVATWSFDPKSPCPCIGFDNRKAMRRITDYVLSVGHRRIAMIIGGQSQMNDRSWERLAGFRESLAAHEIDIDEELIIEIPYSMDGARAAFRHLMSSDKPPTALVCGSDLFAIAAILECRRMSIRVPEDLSITGFDDLEISSHFEPPLTTVHVPARRMGIGAAEFLIEQINGRTGPTHTEFECQLVLRESVAALR